MNMYPIKDLLLKALVLTFIIVSKTTAIADDTEILFSKNAQDVSHNVLFIIDGSGSMNIKVEAGGDTRLDVMKKALETVLKGAPDNLNVGLMNYGEDPYRIEGHGVKFPVSPINQSAYPIISSRMPVDEWGNIEWWNSSLPEPTTTVTVRDYLTQITHWYWKDNWYLEAYNGKPAIEMPRQGATPIVDALYEAALYFRGDKVGFGFGDAGYWNRWAAHPSTYDGPLVKWDSTACASTSPQTITPRINFADNEYPWFTCPPPLADGSPPSYANCANAETCTTLTYNICDELIAGYCTNPQFSEIDGEVCPEGSWVESYCKDEKYHIETIEKCTYDVCDGGYTPQPLYNSPITQECQNNYLILLSDGKPGNTDSLTVNETYSRLQAGDFLPLNDKSDISKSFNHTNCDTNPEPSGFRHGVCGPELTQFLSDSDHSDLPGVQGIHTYSIGFGLAGEADSENYLKSLVTADNPETSTIEGYFSAEDEDQLANAFSTILTEISASASSFAAPAYTVDSTTGLSNEEVIYIPVFDKQLTPRWNGNLKKFLLSKGTDGITRIVGKNNKQALTKLGTFEEDALDLWSTSTSPDGQNVTSGGVLSRLDPNNRLLVSDLNCSSACDLSSKENLITPENTNDAAGLISNAILGLPSTSDENARKTLVDFIRGRTWNEKSQTYDLNPHMGDILHSSPTIVTYDKNYSSSASSNKAYNGQVIFAGTNEGYLHAFDTTSGQELFAFMPSELLMNIDKQYANTSIGRHIYGVDGNISTWHLDNNKDGVIDASSGDRVYLYFGLRRGGRSYYALDVTNPKNPRLLWKVKSSQPNFSRLGQSWSMPYLARIRTSDHDLRPVAIFTGGYDTNQDIEDIADRALEDTVGNDIFVVDALTGQYIWSVRGGTSGTTPISNAHLLTHSIPGGARLLDMNGDNAIDRLYFADTNAQVWRLELPTGPSYNLNDAKLIKFADLGFNTSARTKDARMFFNEPDVALLRSNGKKWLAISIGSGYRAHPAANDIDDHFYMMLDSAVTEPLVSNLHKTADFQTLKLSNLVAISIDNGQVNKGELTGKNIFQVSDKSGWYLKLSEPGEKVLANSLTVTGSVIFTTLVPGSSEVMTASDPCVAPTVQGRTYALSILEAGASHDLDNNQVITDTDLFTVVSSNDIPNKPQLIFNAPECNSDGCKQSVDIRVGKKDTPVTQYDASYLENVFWSDPRQ